MANVGIGKTSPAVPLDVAGQVRTTDGSVDLRMLPIDASNAGIVGTYSNDDLVFNANSSEVMRVRTNSRVGIGTTSPSGKLSVAVSGSDANTSDNLSADFDTWIRIGDALGAKTFTNGTGIKFADSGLVHWSTGILSDGKFAIAKTSSNGSELFPSAKNDALTIDSSLNVNMFGALSITSTASGNADGPIVYLQRDSASPVVNDILGSVRFLGKNDADQDVTYAEIDSIIFDETDGTENGALRFTLPNDGTQTVYLTLGDGRARFQQDARFDDDVKAYFGTGNDLQIFHNGSNSYIDDSSGTGALIFKSNTYSFRNSSDSEQIATFNENGTVELYHDNSKKFETTASGAKISGGTGDAVLLLEADTTNTDEADNAYIEFSQDGGGVTAKSGLGVDGNNRYNIHTTTGSGTTYFDIQGGQETRLYYGTNVKLATTSTGATVTGELVVDDLRMTTGANSLLKFTSNDGTQGYQLKANVSNSADFGLLIEDLDNNDIAKFLDGGECLLTHNHITRFQTTSTGATVTGTLVSDGLKLNDSETITFGTDDDATITHDGSNLIIDSNLGTTLYHAGQHQFKNQFGSETHALFSSNGAVQLYYDNELRFRTTSTGIDVLADDADSGSDNTANVRIISEGTNEIVTLRSHNGGAFYISRSGDNYGTHTFQGFGTVTPNTVNMLQLTSTGHTSYQDLTIQSTDAGATAGPTLSLYRNSASPTSSDDIGQIQWFAENNADEKIEYARIDVRNVGVIDGAEYGQMDFMVLHNGGETTPLRLSFNLVQFYRDLYIGANYKIQFEGNAYNDFETILNVVAPTQDNTILLPDATGEVIVTSGGQTMTSHLQFADNAQLRIGDGNDLVIRHDGGHSLIEDTGTGDLYIRASDNLNIQADNGSGGWHNAIQTQFTGSNSKVAFFNGGTQVFSTLSNGISIDVSGGIRFEGATADGNETFLEVADPTADRTVTLPDATGTVLTTGNSDTPTTTTSSSDADFVLIDDGGTMKKITPSNLGIGSGGGGGSFNGTLTSTDAGAEAGPILTLDRNSASPADDDVLGAVTFKGRNDAGETIEYASFQAKAVDVTDGTEDGRLLFKIHQTDALKTVLDVRQDSFKLNNVTKVVFGDPISQFIFEGATGDAHELTLNITDPTADRTIAVPDASGTIALKSEYFQAYRSSDSAAFTGTFVTIDFDTVTLNSDNSIFVESGGEVTINKAGIFRFSADVTTKITSGSSRSDCEIELQKKPSGGSFSSVAGTTAITYNRTSGRGEQTSSINFMIDVTSGDAYRVVVKRQGGTDTIVVQGGASRFNIQEVN